MERERQEEKDKQDALDAEYEAAEEEKKRRFGVGDGTKS